MSEKITHFGEFIRYHRRRQGQTTEAYARKLGITGRRLIAIEKMAVPEIQHTTLTALAREMGIDPDDFDRAWRETPVAVTRRRAGPTTDESSRFNSACRVANVSPTEGMRRMRSWLVAQDSATQQKVLSFRRPGSSTEPQYTDLVDHVQDPAEAARKRIGERAAKSKSRRSQV